MQKVPNHRAERKVSTVFLEATARAVLHQILMEHATTLHPILERLTHDLPKQATAPAPHPRGRPPSKPSRYVRHPVPLEVLRRPLASKMTARALRRLVDEAFRDLGLHVLQQAEQLGRVLICRLRDIGILIPCPPWAQSEVVARNLLLLYARCGRYDPRVLALAVPPFATARPSGTVTYRVRTGVLVLEVLPWTPDGKDRKARSKIRPLRSALRKAWKSITPDDLRTGGLSEKERKHAADQLQQTTDRRGWVLSNRKLNWITRSLVAIAVNRRPPAHPASRDGGYLRDLRLLHQLAELLRLR